MFPIAYILILAATVLVLAAIILMIRKDYTAYKIAKQEEIALLTQANELLLNERNDLDTQHSKLRLDHLKLSKNYQDRTTLLQSLTQRITKYRLEGVATSSQLEKLLSIIAKDASQEKDALIIHLEQVNTTYVDRLKAAHPKLTVYDYRLCTLIKTGMSTREIANLLNVLPSSVNVSRSRLRKKLGLTPKQDLYAVLNEL